MTQVVYGSSYERRLAAITKTERREGFSDKEILAIRHAYRATGDIHAMMAAIGWMGKLGVFRTRCIKLGIPISMEDRLKGQGRINEDMQPRSSYNLANIPSWK